MFLWVMKINTHASNVRYPCGSKRDFWHKFMKPNSGQVKHFYSMHPPLLLFYFTLWTTTSKFPIFRKSITSHHTTTLLQVAVVWIPHHKFVCPSCWYYQLQKIHKCYFKVDPSGKTSTPNFNQICPTVLDLNHADRQTDMISPICVHSCTSHKECIIKERDNYLFEGTRRVKVKKLSSFTVYIVIGFAGNKVHFASVQFKLRVLLLQAIIWTLQNDNREKLLSLNYCHWTIVTELLSLNYCHWTTVIELLSLNYCHLTIVTELLSLN
jgi:hypothetical protein